MMGHTYIKYLDICFVYHPSFCTIQEGWENNGMVHWMEMSSLSQTCFLSLSSALEAFDICVSSSATSLLLLVTMESIYLNLFTYVSTWPSICMSWPMSWEPGKGWYITSVFLKLILSSNAFADFKKQVIISNESWWLCAMKAVSSAKMTLHTRTFLFFSCRLKLTGIEQVFL